MHPSGGIWEGQGELGRVRADLEHRKLTKHTPCHTHSLPPCPPAAEASRYHITVRRLGYLDTLSTPLYLLCDLDKLLNLSDPDLFFSFAGLKVQTTELFIHLAHGALSSLVYEGLLSLASILPLYLQPRSPPILARGNHSNVLKERLLVHMFLPNRYIVACVQAVFIYISSIVSFRSPTVIKIHPCCCTSIWFLAPHHYVHGVYPPHLMSLLPPRDLQPPPHPHKQHCNDTTPMALYGPRWLLWGIFLEQNATVIDHE